MKKIKLICAGKTRESYIQLGLQEFEKKLKPYCQYTFQSIKEENYRQGDLRTSLTLEGKRLLRCQSKNSILVVCDERGKQLDSIRFADHFVSWANQGKSEINFIIGGPFGLGENVKTASDFLLSFSQFTMTHQMIRLFLVEQIYRSFTIIHGQKYHHH